MLHFKVFLTSNKSDRFRWAVCQLDVIQRLKGERNVIQKALKNLPKTLDETYDRVLLTLPEEDHQFVHHALQLILYHNNLYGGKLDGGIPCAMLIKGVEKSIAGLNSDQNDRFYDHEILRELCGCLINVTHGHSDFNYVVAGTLSEMGAQPQHEVLTVSLAHYTVHEYLRSKRISENCTAYVTSCKEDLQQTFLETFFSESLQVESAHDAVKDGFQTYCVVSALCSLPKWSARISRHDMLSKLAIDLLDSSRAHFQFLESAAELVENLNFPFWDEQIQFWNLIWVTEPSGTDAAHLLNLLLLASVSPEYLELARKFLQGKDNKKFLETRLVFRKRGHFFKNRYEFDGSIIEFFAPVAFEASGIFRLLLEHGTGLFDPSAVLLLLIERHHRHPDYECNGFCLVQRLLDLGADQNVIGCAVTPCKPPPNVPT